jgi:hypothetical protein
MEQGRKVNEHASPLARNLISECIDVESGNVRMSSPYDGSAISLLAIFFSSKFEIEI